MVTGDMRTMHLFAGAGGGLLADLILGHEPICAIDSDPYACAVLRERTRDDWFPGLHVHEGDIRLFDPSDYAGRVDCIAAGFPCQDISTAGRGRGIEGTRSGLWSEVVRVASIVEPRFLFLENSAAITSRGLDVVMHDLSAMGFDAEWCVLSACSVGAPHRRARWWCVARRADADGSRQTRARVSQRSRDDKTIDGRICADVPDAIGKQLRLQPGRSEWANGEAPPIARKHGELRIVANPNLQRRDRRVFEQTAADKEGHARAEGINSWWSSEPDMGRVAHGVAARVDRLTCIGNGQVPLQAAAAWQILTRAFE